MSPLAPTIETRDGLAQDTIGARAPGPTFYDVAAVNRAYGCPRSELPPSL